MKRSYNVNMPQMALGGLSEAWLFRELGDLHWAMICQGLGARSSELADANGDRLYATFTRIRIESSIPLLAYRENDHLEAEASISRFGGAVFLGEASVTGERGSIRAELMSSFTKRSNPGSNLSLLKGQPAVPEDCAVPLLGELPQFAQEYRAVRAVRDRPVLFESDYELLPYHDINGVGLLYFAAYPTINDLSELGYVEDRNDWCLNFSTRRRDVYYFGNCNLGDRIIYRLHEAERGEDEATLTSSLVRASDQAPIAHLVTTKTRLAEAEDGRAP